MEEITLKNCVKTAIKAEELGIKFYSEYSKKFQKYPEIKDLFKQLAKDEVDHKKQFTGLLEEVPDEDVKPDETDREFLEAVDVSKFFPNMEAVDQKMSPKDVLTAAYDFEKESVLFYNGIRDLFDRQIKVLDEIVKLEKSHMTRIMKYLVNDSEFRGLGDKWD